ncbi:MAG: fibronectin type III domain-containing protein [Bacteroides sp.]|nr:fibronectin type III domain-containing protein [Bacteroides sp.]
MKNIFDIKLWSVLALVSLAFTFTACDDDDKMEADRLFRPIASLSATTYDGRALITVEIETGIAEAVRYDVELYRDSLGAHDTGFTPVATGTITEVTAVDPKYVFGEKEQLAWDTKYYVRVKAVGTSMESYFYVPSDITTDDYPTSLKTIAESEITDEAVLIRWETPEEPYTVLDLTNSKDSVLQRYDISLVTDNYFIIEDLEPETDYKLKVYVGAMPAAPAEGQPYTAMADEAYRGKKTFTTKATQEYDNMYDLTQHPDDEAIDMITTAFLDGLENEATVLVKGGLTYNINAVTINKSVKFVSKYSLDGYANFAIEANFRLPNNGEIEKIEFENLNIYTPGADENSANFGGGYIFNINTTTKVGTILLEGCNISFFRGIVRTQAGPEIENLIYNNCTINYIGGYAIATCDNADSKILNVQITRSTIMNVDRAVISTRGDELVQSLTVDECTFYNTPSGSNILFDFNTFTVSANIQNSIFGAASAAKPFRAGTTPDLSNTYITGDFIMTANEFETDLLGGKYSGNSTDLFSDPENGNFTIIDRRFDGATSAGDPRWR